MALSEADICIAILNWNGIRHLQEFLPSVLSRSGNARIRVIDNASTDHSVEWIRQNHPSVELDVLDKNYGFTGGYNRGIARLDAPLVVLLNSDVEVRQGWLLPLLRSMNADARLAACQPKILNLKKPGYFEYAGACGGFLDTLGYPFCRGRIFDVCEKDEQQYQASREVFWASGACMMVRRDAFLETGGLEEAFFAHMEEIDLCWRFWHQGWKVRIEPDSEVLHLGAGTLAKSNPRKTYLNFRNGLAMLYINNFGFRTYALVLLRLMLDGLAGIQFLLKGESRNLAAILKAHFAFYRQLSYWQKRRKANARAAIHPIPPEIQLRSSIVWRHFAERVDVFSGLKF